MTNSLWLTIGGIITVILITVLHVNEMNKHAETEEEKTSVINELNPLTWIKNFKETPQSFTYSLGFTSMIYGVFFNSILITLFGAILVDGTAIWIHIIKK